MRVELAIGRAQRLGIPYEEFEQFYTGLSTAIYLVRHGDTDFNTGEERIRSLVDLPLAESGLLAADRIGVELRDAGIACIYTSDMKRAKQTARGIELHTSAEFEKCPGLRAWNLGELAGRKSADVKDIIDDLLANPEKFPPGSDENYAMFCQRNMSAYEEIAAKSLEPIVIVSHHSNCLLLFEKLGMDTDIKPGEYVRLR